MKEKTSQISFGAGCFWCTEAVFSRIQGVLSVESGYQGGTVENPTYKQICRGDTGHAEVVRVTFDPEVVSVGNLLELFWTMHDPTTPDRQGADVGTQYRSVIFYSDEEHGQTAREMKRKLDADKVFPAPVVTQIEPAPVFYPAEDYHQDYYENNAGNPYCRIVIAPKLKKLNLK